MYKANISKDCCWAFQKLLWVTRGGIEKTGKGEWAREKHQNDNNIKRNWNIYWTVYSSKYQKYIIFMFGQLCRKKVASYAQVGGYGQTEAVPSGQLVLGDGGRRQPGLRSCTNPLCPSSSSILAETKPASTALWDRGYLAPGEANPLCESFCGHCVLFLPPARICFSFWGWDVSALQIISMANRQDEIYTTATCRTQAVLVGYREVMEIKTCIKYELLHSESQAGKSNGCFAKQQRRARLPLTLGIIVMETTSKVAQNTSRYEKGSWK